jgi:hypothetical protein
MPSQIRIKDVAQVGPYSLRVRFDFTWEDGTGTESKLYHTPVPYMNTDHPNNALRSNLYTVRVGSTDLTTQIVSVVPDHFDCVDVTTEEEIVGGVYSLAIDSTGLPPIKNWYDQELKSLVNDSYVYVVSSIICKKLSPSAKPVTLEDLVRRYLSPVLDGPNFRSLIAALVVGEKYNADNFKSAFDQLYVNKASSPYLERLGANYGIYQRQGAEMDDDSFRHYIQTFYNKKLTEDALYSMLQVFYGFPSVCAYALSASTTLGSVTDEENVFVFRFDGVKEVTITIKDTDFTEYTNANAAMLIDRNLKEQQVFAHCDMDLNGKVRLFSNTKGLRSSVEVLQQPSWIDFTQDKKWTLYSNPNPAYMGIDAEGTLQIFLPVLSTVVEGRNSVNGTYVDSFSFGSFTQTVYPGAQQTTLDEALVAKSYTSIKVTDASQLVQSSGFIFIGYGFDYQQGPIEYTSISGNTLTIKPHTITKLVPNGTEVNQAITPQLVDGTITTFPSGSLDLLVDTLVDMIPAGTKYKINKVYPQLSGLDDVTGIYS